MIESGLQIMVFGMMGIFVVMGLIITTIVVLEKVLNKPAEDSGE